MVPKRRKFQGVLNILSFNRHFYVAGFGLLLVMLVSHMFAPWPPVIFAVTIITFLYGLLMPLIVSTYVYDFSGYYTLDWMKDLIRERQNARHLINISAGFDETSFIIKSKFPDSALKAFDFYNAKQHTEPAIKRARKVSLVYPDTKQVASTRFPLESQSVDIIFLLSAAHEIRSNEERIGFLKECHRVCSPEARIVLVEHLRDLPNFIAFTIGFTHFFSRATWRHCLQKAGFSILEERKFTAFMSIFVCKP